MGYRYNSESDDDDDMMSVDAPPAKPTRGARGRGARGAGRGASRGAGTPARGGAARGARGRPAKNPVVMSQSSIKNAFAKQGC